MSYRSCITRKVISLGEIGRGEEGGAGLEQEIGSPRSDVGRQGRGGESRESSPGRSKWAAGSSTCFFSVKQRAMDPGNLAGNRDGECHGRARVQGGSPCGTPQGMEGIGSKAQSLWRRKGLERERESPRPRQMGELRTSKTPESVRLMAQQKTNGYHPLVS